MDNKILSAKYAYLLSTCSKFANRAFIALIKKFETNKVLSSKYHYELWFTLDFDANVKTSGDTFHIKRVYNKFLNSFASQDLNYDILNELNALSDVERAAVRDNFRALLESSNSHFPEFEDHCKKHLFTPANLINMYHRARYNYLFISLILDYSQDIGVVHQCGIIINLHEGEFLFYEPYGTYIKYRHNYSEPIREFFQVFYDVLPPEFKTPSGKIRFNSFHGKYGIPEGIQQILLRANNSNSGKFTTVYNSTLKDIKRDFPKLHTQIENIYTDGPIYSTDKTMIILDVLSRFNGYHIGVDEDGDKFAEYWKIMLGLYHDYNSKTCVSITLVEFYNYFNNSHLGNDLSASVTNYIKQYTEADDPNKILFGELFKFINECMSDFHKFIVPQETLNTGEICGTL